MTNTKKTCAIYTRKSTDERLDMEFNTLDAQREACEAYILSQRSEGWQSSDVQYDDGGYSGGNLDRPALKQLLNDIKAGRVHIVVVYKIDRLTRSLMDFSKLVDIFDEHGVTFVSVTQSFNTTTSMGRLTLNVLLSFAQFEREVTGERIRDKIAASKAKGMWMGGKPPVGYHIENRRLVIETNEAKITKHIFDRYLALGNVRDLKKELDHTNIVSPIRKTLKGNLYGGSKFSRGALYAILKNPAYIGKVPHKEKSYDGLHAAIIDQDIWQKVQEKLAQQTVSKNKRMKRKHLLKGLLFDSEGTTYSPTYTKRHNREYNYYISQNLLQYKDHPKGVLARLPAHEIEKFVEQTLRQQILSLCADIEPQQLKYVRNHQDKIPYNELLNDCVEKIILNIDTVILYIKPSLLSTLIEVYLKLNIKVKQIPYELTVPFRLRKSSHGTQIIETPSQDKGLFDLPSATLKKIILGTIWREDHFNGATLKDIAKREKYSQAYVGKAIFESLDFPV